MMVPFASFRPMEEELGDKLRAAFEEVLASSSYIRGEQCRLFEAEFAEVLGGEDGGGAGKRGEPRREPRLVEVAGLAPPDGEHAAADAGPGASPAERPDAEARPEVRFRVPDGDVGGGTAGGQFPERGVGHGVVVDEDVRRLARHHGRRIFDVGDRDGAEQVRRTEHAACGTLDDHARRAMAGENGADVGFAQFGARDADDLPAAQGGVAPDAGQLEPLARLAGEHVDVEDVGSPVHASHSSMAPGASARGPGALTGRGRSAVRAPSAGAPRRSGT